MKSFVTIVVVSALAGVGVGAALGFMEVRPATIPPKPTQSVPKQQDKSAPRAEVSEKVFNFGKIGNGATMSHVFKISNVGARPLEVEVGSTTCKCTVGDLSKSKVEPGEQTEVQLEWTAKTGLGPFRQSATLHTNDPLQPQIELTVEGQVVASSVALHPTELVFGTVRFGQSKDAQLYLLTYLDQELEVSEYEITDKQLAAQIDLRIEPVAKEKLPDPDATSGLKVLATFHPGKVPGPIHGLLTLNTNLEGAEKFNIPIAGQLVGDISIYGPGWRVQQGLLQLGTVRSSVGKKVRLNLTIHGIHAKTTEFEIASVDPPELKVTLGKRREMNDQLAHVPLIVEVPVGTRPMVRLGKPASTDALIVLRTNHPETSELRLRVHFAVGP